MLLRKDGITVNPLHGADISRFKRLGYVEVEAAAEEPKDAAVRARLKSAKVADLQDEAEGLGLAYSGAKKADLIELILDAYAQGVTLDDEGGEDGS